VSEAEANASTIAPEALDTAPSDAASEPEPTADARDYEARLRSDPEFAFSEAKKHQARADRALNDLKQKEGRYRELDPWIDNLGGSQAVLHHLGRLGAINANPALRSMIEEFERTGRVPNAGATDSQTDAPEEYLDPVERKVKLLEAELAQLKAGFGNTQADMAKERTKALIGEVLKEHDWLSQDQKVSALQALEQNIAQWDRTESGRQLLGNLTKDQLRKFVRATVLDNDDALYEVAERIVRERAEKKRAAATSVAAPVSTNGREVTSRRAMTAIEAVNEAIREVERAGLRRG
jgi:hypothetical protein